MARRMHNTHAQGAQLKLLTIPEERLEGAAIGHHILRVEKRFEDLLHRSDIAANAESLVQ